ncbi:F-box protein PP2-A13 [Trifolium repens]|nr:F-box protein PP2-A13 [Trifolium repens]
MDPPQICKLASLNRAFRAASSADFVWESKLPPNYDVIISKIFDTSFSSHLGKRGIYSRLCSLNTFDGGTKKVWLDRSMGKLCLSILAKRLSITYIDDRRYWNHIPTQESRFSCVSYLQLHLGKASKRFGRRICNIEHVHGWDIKPVRFQLWTSDGQYVASHCFLKGPGKWRYYHAGDFVVEDGNVSTKVKFSMTQIDCTHTKGGLCLDSVFVYPSEFRKVKEFLNYS